MSSTRFLNTGGNGGVGAYPIGDKADGTKAIFATKDQLDTYTTAHPTWFKSFKSDVCVGIGTSDVELNYAYIKKSNEWVDIATNFKGDKGDKGNVGDNGADGKDGADGANGKDGESVEVLIDGEPTIEKLKRLNIISDGLSTEIEDESISISNNAIVISKNTIIKQIDVSEGLESEVENNKLTISTSKFTQVKIDAETQSENFVINKDQDDSSKEFIINYEENDLSCTIQLYPRQDTDGKSIIITNKYNNINHPRLTKVEVYDDKDELKDTHVVTNSNTFTQFENIFSFHGNDQYFVDEQDQTSKKYVAIVNQSNKLSMYVNQDVLYLSDKNEDPTNTIDIVFWWSENQDPTKEDILNSLGQAQSNSLISHHDNLFEDSLETFTFEAKREENSFKYLYFAWKKGFFSPEPSLVETDLGGNSIWLRNEIDVDNQTYITLTVEVTNNLQERRGYKLIKEGVR